MITVDPDLEARTIVEQFQQCLLRGTSINKDAPKLFMRILRDEFWRRPGKDGKVFTHVEQFIAASMPYGLGSDIEAVKRIIRDDPQALDMLDRALQATERRGRPEKNVSNRNDLSSRPVGTTRQHALRVLREKRPDLHQDVLAGRKSPHAAMVEAGFRKATMTIPCDPVEAARVLKQKFQREDWMVFIKALSVPKQES
jgi:hypothetical protein